MDGQLLQQDEVLEVVKSVQEKFELVLGAAQIGLWEWRADTNRFTLTKEWRRQLGYDETEAPATPEYWATRIHPDDVPAMRESLVALHAGTRKMHQLEARFRHKEDGYRWIYVRGRLVEGESGQPRRFVGVHFDNTPRKRAEVALAHQKEVLERIAKGEPLSAVLDAIVRHVEAQTHDAICSILLLCGDQLFFTAGKNVPAGWIDAHNGFHIGPEVGSCGSAAYHGRSVVTEDIAADPRWDLFRETALRHGIRSCWSVPIFPGKLAQSSESQDRVLGTFAIYGRAPRRPTEEEQEAVRDAVHLAGIAIERVRTEEAVRQSKEMLQVVLDNIPQGVLWKDRHSRYLGMNAVVREAMGGDESKILGKNDLEIDLLPREHAEFFMKKDEEVMRENRPQFQILEPMTIADGRTIWLNTNKIPLHNANGEVNGVLVTWEDFTEKRRAQEAQAQHLAWLQKAQQIAKVTAWEYDVAQNKFEIPEGGLEVLNLPSTLTGFEDIEKSLHPDDIALLHADWDNVRNGKPFNTVHRFIIDGEVRWIAVRAEPEFDKAGKVVRVVGASQDITERKRLEEQLLQAQKYEGLGVLAGGIAHEFNNILTSVLGNAELGQLGLPDDSPAASIFAEIAKSARKAAGLTKQMLAYSGRGQMASAPLRLDQIITDAAPVLLSMAAQKAEIEFELSPAAAFGDAVQLRQVALQLVSNAIDALDGKGGRIIIRTGECELNYEESAEEFPWPPRVGERYAFLKVIDTGCGMPPEIVAKIFDPFFSTKFVGRGLGLAAVQGIVRRHLGALRVQSAPGEGTGIKIMIPQRSVSATNPVAPEAPRKPSATHILLVEDESLVREFLFQLLTGAGYRVTMAKSGAEAIAAAQKLQHEPPIILLDLAMPEIDGWMALERLGELLPNSPVMVMSGFDEAEFRRTPPKRAIAAYLQKPFRPAQLFAAIQQTLESATNR